ncbi:hypothetical protein [Phyllobacterium endophyticum]|uniref:Uncharacterized protein n=1 Tax=Phyllobacterium endophyticum TaxID=1149773 RepID=A0A2P7B0K0_9HYPH|nr:hypothetical protein [Phyllobacterium endophyticum]MBB3235304.1 hypothetical protein [Phyllobacterium endophyticum]PSH60006.1 hypothetical protein CU100_04585 [Phyllobacterium endophyticum]TYR42178.1 hypothetical protein FY050_13200 [Phyllobacterium endophyticum]
MTYAQISQADFLKGGLYTEVLGCWTHISDFSGDVKDAIFGRSDDVAPDYYTPIAKGKEWLFELTCKHQPRTGALLMAGGPLFVRVKRRSDGGLPALHMGLEVRDKVVLISRDFWGDNPSDPDYQANIDRITAFLTKRDGKPNHAEQRQLSLPLPIREAYYTRFDGMDIPDDEVVGIYSRFLPYPVGRPWQSWDGYLKNFRGYKKRYIPWLEDRLGIVPTPFDRKYAYISFMMFMAAGPNPAGREGDVFFVKNADGMQDGVIYHIKDAHIENMRILSEPAEAIDRYCEHVLLEREGRFDFLPYTSEM